jgi:hypothetical protein
MRRQACWTQALTVNIDPPEIDPRLLKFGAFA